ncbi:MAG: hypothetical protein IKD29_03175 [Lentisphaeria bacterium]|nr:hypothetical protein [Lentisphaeria bacterium]
MRKFVLFVVPALIFSAVFCGCSTPKVIVDGIEYEALSRDEIKELCGLAELYLNSNIPNVISRQEAGFIRRLAPEYKIKYYGDRTGKAVIRWSLPKRKIEVVFDGLLLDPSAKCWVQSEDVAPEVIDFTKKRPKEQPVSRPVPKRTKRRARR